MYSIEINYREGTRTTKKVIGKICPICDIPRKPTDFWSKFSKDKNTLKLKRENLRGTRFSPRLLGRTICDLCKKPTKMRFRKIWIDSIDFTYEVTCECGNHWRQKWRNYKELEKLGWVPKRPVI